MAPALTPVELWLVENVLEMKEGYVLNFSDRTFREFFQQLDIDIDDPLYLDDGTSKAKRLRRFLRISEPAIAGRALDALLEYRLATDSSVLPEAQLTAFRKIIERLKPTPPNDAREDALAQRTFDARLFEELPLRRELIALLCSRMGEAERCLQVRAHLSAVILCGSVLEGLCLGFIKQHVEPAKRAYCRIFQTTQAPPLEQWSLANFIAVLGNLGLFSPTIEKFSHSLRDFRNFVHPDVALRNEFAPDQHGAKIAFQVVLAAVDDLMRAATNQKNKSNG